MTLTVTLIFIFFVSASCKRFPNSSEITSTFQCLLKHFYLINVRSLNPNLYAAHDSVAIKPLVIEIFRQGEELELSLSHSS